MPAHTKPPITTDPSVHNTDIRETLTHTTPYTLLAVSQEIRIHLLAIIFVIIAALVSALFTIVDSVLIINDMYSELKRFSREGNYLIYELVIAITDIFTDILTPFSMIIYLKKDTDNLKVVMLFEDNQEDHQEDYQENSEFNWRASEIEDKLTKFMLKMKEKSNPISININESFVN